MPGMRAFVFSGAGILRRRDDYQLRDHDRNRCGDFSFVAAASGFHHVFDQFQNPDLDGMRHCFVVIVCPALLQLLARN